MFFLRILSLFFIILYADITTENESIDIEVFDISNETVILQSKMNENIRRKVIHMIDQIDGIYPKVQPIPQDGLIIKISLQPNVYVETEWFVDLIDEVIIFYTEEDDPYLLLFNQENETFFLTTRKSSLSLFLQLLNSSNLDESLALGKYP